MLGDVPDDTQDVPQGVLTGVLLAGERAGKHQGGSPGRAAIDAVLFFRILALEGGGQPGPQAKLGNATALPVLGLSKLSSDSIFPLGFYTRI